jgi:hypothetical protein
MHLNVMIAFAVSRRPQYSPSVNFSPMDHTTPDVDMFAVLARDVGKTGKGILDKAASPAR